MKISYDLDSTYGSEQVEAEMRAAFYVEIAKLWGVFNASDCVDTRKVLAAKIEKTAADLAFCEANGFGS